MGKRGPKPKPTPLKILDGTRKDRVNSAEPKSPPGRPDPPPAVTADPVATEAWNRLLPLLEEMGVLSPIDGGALAVYCTAYSRWAEACEDIRLTGSVVATDNGGRVNPYVRVAQEASATMLRVAAEFGGTPSSRSAIRTDKARVDPFEDFLKKKPI